MQKIDVLDHGFVRLVDHMGSDLSIVRAARVSHDAAWRAGSDHASDARLINYLWRNQHTTPFEAVEFQFEVKAPIFVLRQWMRHRTWSYNEVSARYREVAEEFYLPEISAIGAQSTSNKQGRETPLLDADLASARAIERRVFADLAQRCFRHYRTLLDKGWPRELARGILPVSTYSTVFAKVDLLNLLKFLTLRLDLHAQLEIRLYAEALCDLVRPIVPVAMAAWQNSPHPEPVEGPGEGPGVRVES